MPPDPTRNSRLLCSSHALRRELSNVLTFGIFAPPTINCRYAFPAGPQAAAAAAAAAAAVAVASVVEVVTAAVAVAATAVCSSSSSSSSQQQ